MDGIQAHARRLKVLTFYVVLFLSMGKSSFAGCLQLAKPEPLLVKSATSPRNRITAIGLVEVKVGWNTCKTDGNYVLRLRDSRGKESRHQLFPSQLSEFSTVLLLNGGKNYVLSLERHDPEGRVAEKVERKFFVHETPEKSVAMRSTGRRISSIAGTIEASDDTYTPWAEAYGGLGFVSYVSSLGTEENRFSLPALSAGLQTTADRGLGGYVHLLQSVGSTSSSATNTAESFFSYAGGMTYKFRLHEEFALSPFLQVSQYFLNLSSANVNQMNSLQYFSAGVKADWSRGNFDLASTLGFAPALGGSTSLNRLELGLQPGMRLGGRSSLRIPANFQLYTGTSASGETRISVLNLAAVFSSSW